LVLLAKIPDVEAKEYVPVRYVFWESVAVGPAKGIEHAITNAFRYPYGVKIKSILGLNNNRIKISKKNFHREEREAKNRFAAERIFAHLGVSPIKISPRDSYPAGLKKEGVHKMALGERMKRQEDGNEYVELNIEQQSPKTAKIVVHSLQRFSETDRIAKSIRANNIVFVGLKTMKQTNMDELKQAVAKINKICVQNGSSISLVDDEWLIIAPQNAAIA
ncbi:MAG: cell division protein SepF, partial [Candidatus Aenigmatarchaeota archaeon]